MRATIRPSTSKSKSARKRSATIRDRTKSWRKSSKQSRMRDNKQPYSSTNKRSISTHICANTSATLMTINAWESSSTSLEMRRRVQSLSSTVWKLFSMDVSMSSMTSVMWRWLTSKTSYSSLRNVIRHTKNVLMQLWSSKRKSQKNGKRSIEIPSVSTIVPWNRFRSRIATYLIRSSSTKGRSRRCAERQSMTRVELVLAARQEPQNRGPHLNLGNEND